MPSAKKLSFNPKVRDLVAVGYGDGSVAVYRLPYSLSNLQEGELKILSKLFDTKKENWIKDNFNYNKYT